MGSNDNARDGYKPEQQSRTRARWLWILVALSVVGVTGCTATLRTMPNIGGYTVAAVDGVPYALDEYPRYYYGDRYAYLIDGSWYYPTNRGWVMFMEEPRPLAQYRMRLQTAPPATRRPDVQYGYPPPRPTRPTQPTQPRELRREYRPR